MAQKTVKKKAAKKATAPKEGPYAWVTQSPKDIGALIEKLAKEGNPPSRIGIILRDQYGVPDVAKILNKKIGKVLEEKGLRSEIPEDLMELIKKAVALDRHLSENRKDFHSKRGMELTESKINSLAKYYKKNGRLSQDWKYDIATAKLIVR